LEVNRMAITESDVDDPLEGGLMIKLPRRGDYGFDGDRIELAGMGVIGVVALATAVFERAGHVGIAAVAAFVVAYFVAMIGFYLHTTRRGKFIIWAEILGTLDLRGDERVLDAGCLRKELGSLVSWERTRSGSNTVAS
jgi:hypothetical protein